MRNCVFCKIIKGELSAEFIYKDNDFVVFKDINPHAPVHLLIVPKEHIKQPVSSRIDKNTLMSLGRIFSLSKKIAKLAGIEKTGWRLVQNNGKDPGQVIEHFHIHLLGGKRMTL